METLYTIAILAGLVILIAVPYWRNMRVHGAASEKKFEKNQKAGLLRPVTMHPHIDLDLCIGCASCVQICPEDVLGMVKGKSAIIAGVKCVGHALCVDVCPVGAIELKFGTPSQGMEIPYYNDKFETNIKRLYIVGELGGMGLIRNAVNQAVTAVEDISARPLPPADAEFDLVIIGGGPAGLTAALAAKAKNLKYTILEQDEVGGSILHYPRKKLVLTQPVELPLFGKLKGPEITKEDLLDLWHSIIRDNQLRIQRQQKVAAIRKNGDRFEIETATGTFTSRAAVLAIGRRGSPRKLGVPGEQLPHVLYRLIEAESYRNAKVLVVGGGDSAVEAALALATQEGNEVAISYRRPEFVRLKERNEERMKVALSTGKVKVHFETEAVEIKPDRALLRKGQADPFDVPADHVFVFAGGELPGELLKKTGIRLRTNEMRTGPEAEVLSR